MVNSNTQSAWQALRDRAHSRPACLANSAVGSLQAAGLYANCARHAIDDSTLVALLSMAEQAGVQERISACLSGQPVNSTQGRAAWHSALRYQGDQPLLLDGQNIQPDIAAVLQRMGVLSRALSRGELLGAGQQPITDIINIGIGGSDLGPAMVYEALSSQVTLAANVHFVANVDRAALQHRLAQLNPASTLVITVSKSFSTYETLTNTQRVKDWMQQAGLSREAIDSQCYAVTANTERAMQEGIARERIFPLWDWVGGRFSVWSAVGLSIALALGIENFNCFLAGADAMDCHVKTVQFSRNIPVMLGLIGFWYGTFLQSPTQAIIPYADALHLLPDYLQQLHMESLGKQVDVHGRRVDYATGRIIWGGVGTSTQHSFHQLLMQGTHLVPVDFILPLNDASGQRNTDLIANALAQSEVLWHGTPTSNEQDSLDAHRRIPGGCPSTLIMMDQLTPYTLGALIALYEHKVLVQSALWNINAFDQWGVERGKLIAQTLLLQLQSSCVKADTDAVTKALLQRVFEGVEE